MPLEHVVAACGVGRQGKSQAPQCSTSLARSKHVLAQQENPATQSCCGLQPGMHVEPMQIDPAAQFASLVQPTQLLLATSQTKPFATSQSVSSVQPGRHVSFLGSQNWPWGHVSFVGRHGTHLPVPVSQSAPPALPTQSASLLQPIMPLLDVAPPAPFPPLPSAVPPAPPDPLLPPLPEPDERPDDVDVPSGAHDAADVTPKASPATSAAFRRGQVEGEPGMRLRSAIGSFSSRFSSERS
jgi:hypothetical protein